MNLIRAAATAGALPLVLVLGPAAAQEPDNAHVEIALAARKMEAGRKPVVAYDIRRDATKGRVRVTLERVDGGYSGVFRDKTSVSDGKTVVFSMPRLQETGEYTLVAKWTGRDGEVVTRVESFDVR